MTLGINLSFVLQEGMLVCNATIHANWRSIPTGFAKKDEPTAESASRIISLDVAETEGLGINDDGWTWYEEKYIADSDNGGKLIFGERGVEEVQWWIG